MSPPSKRDYLQRIHGRYQRAGRRHKTRILNEFCAICKRNGIFLAIERCKYYPGNRIKMIEHVSLLDLLVSRPTAVRFLSVLLGGPRIYGMDVYAGIHATKALALTNSFAKSSQPTVLAHAGNGVTYAGSYEASA